MFIDVGISLYNRELIKKIASGKSEVEIIDRHVERAVIVEAIEPEPGVQDADRAVPEGRVELVAGRTSHQRNLGRRTKGGKFNCWRTFCG
jgi:hypothetical protein